LIFHSTGNSKKNQQTRDQYNKS